MYVHLSKVDASVRGCAVMRENAAALSAGLLPTQGDLLAFMPNGAQLSRGRGRVFRAIRADADAVAIRAPHTTIFLLQNARLCDTAVTPCPRLAFPRPDGCLERRSVHDPDSPRRFPIRCTLAAPPPAVGHHGCGGARGRKETNAGHCGAPRSVTRAFALVPPGVALPPQV